MGVQTTPPPSAAASRLLYGPSQTRGASSAGENAWLAGVIERLVDTAPSLEALPKHRLQLAAARLWRSRGRAVPADFVSDERAAATRAMFARRILGKVRSAYGGDLMLLTGPEVAAHYPVSSDRAFRDLDLLVEDPAAAHRALLEAGFVQVADPALFGSHHHHLTPLMWPGAPLVVEVHRRPSRPEWLEPVPGQSMFRVAGPSATRLPGLLAPDPAAHAVLERMWHTTLAVMDAVLGEKRRDLASKLWARHLLDVRERMVLENHISRLAAPVWSLRASGVPQAIAGARRDTAAREPDENWITKLRRSRLAIAHAFTYRSAHEQSLTSIGATGRKGGRTEQA